MAKSLVFRWATVKGLTAIILFLLIAALIEYGIVIYAISLGVKEQNLLLGTVSPLFHLIPLSVIIALTFCWICMTKYAAAQHPKPIERKAKTKLPKERRIPKKERRLLSKMSDVVNGFLGKMRSKFQKSRGVSYIWGKVSFTRTTIKSALITILVFSAIVLLVSVIVYPALIYKAFSNLYQDNPSLLELVKSINNASGGLRETLAPIGWLYSVINNAIISAAPAIRGFASTLGGLVKPLVNLPPIGKYLVIQNLAAWVSTMTVFLYGFFTRKGYRIKKAKRS